MRDVSAHTVSPARAMRRRRTLTRPGGGGPAPASGRAMVAPGALLSGMRWSSIVALLVVAASAEAQPVAVDPAQTSPVAAEPQAATPPGLEALDAIGAPAGWQRVPDPLVVWRS